MRLELRTPHTHSNKHTLIFAEATLPFRLVYKHNVPIQSSVTVFCFFFSIYGIAEENARPLRQFGYG